MTMGSEAQLAPAWFPRIVPLSVFLRLILAGASPLAGEARAQDAPPLFLVDSQFDSLVTSIHEVDPSTGSMVLKADLGTDMTPVLGMAAVDRRVLYLAATDNSGADACEGLRSCLLVRVVLDPTSTTPAAMEVIGPVRHEGAVVNEIVGMTFRSDGTLYVVSQRNDTLYVVRTDTAEATRIGTVDIDVEGGDITFDGEDTLWFWTNLPDLGGLYTLDPETAEATLVQLRPDLGFAGMAALGHSRQIYGAHPPKDTLYAFDSASVNFDLTVGLTEDGRQFDHKRGDLDSPYCSSDAACEDENPCTVDTCTAGGCRQTSVPGCCLSDMDCVDEDACTIAERCQDTHCVRDVVDPDDGNPCTEDFCDPSAGPLHAPAASGPDSDSDGVTDCQDACPMTGPDELSDSAGCSAAQWCPCQGPGRPWRNHGEYVSCVVAVAEAIAFAHPERLDAEGEMVRQAARSECGKTSGSLPRAILRGLAPRSDASRRRNRPVPGR